MIGRICGLTLRQKLADKFEEEGIKAYMAMIGGKGGRADFKAMSERLTDEGLKAHFIEMGQKGGLVTQQKLV